MKKSLLLTLSLAAAPLFAGEAPMAPITIVTPTPAPAAAAPALLPLDVEIAGFYGFAREDIYRGGNSKDIDIYGVDLTFVHPIDKNQSLNLRVGYAFGDEVDPQERSWGTKREIDVHTFVLMPGWRYTEPLNEKWSVYGGINLGIASVSVKDHMRSYEFGDTNGAHDSALGFAYSAEVGLRYQIHENGELFAALQFCGSTANPKPTYNWGGGAAQENSVHQQIYGAIRAGYSHKF